MVLALLLFSRGGDDVSASHGSNAFPAVPFVNDYSVGLDGDLAGGTQPLAAIGSRDGPVGDPQQLTQVSSNDVFDPFGAAPPNFKPRTGGHLPASGVLFTPCAGGIGDDDCWGVAPGAFILNVHCDTPTADPPCAGGDGHDEIHPFGTTVGFSSTLVTLGVINGVCLGTVPVPEPLLNAETDTTSVIVAAQNFTNMIVDEFTPAEPLAGHATADDPSAAPHGHDNGVADGADYYPDLLNLAIPPATVGDPIQRSYVQIIKFQGTDTNVTADVVTYAPDQLVPLGIPAGLGFATVVVVENFNPAEVPDPSLITDQCGFEPTVVWGAGIRVNPAAPGTKIFFSLAQSRLDADDDTHDNDMDRCPYDPDVPFPFADIPDAAGLAPLVTVLPRDIAGTPNDGIPDSCDPDSDGVQPGNFDGDDFLNAQDNCWEFDNDDQAESETLSIAIPNPTGATSDSIGDVCDFNPTVADGHFHTVLSNAYICITGVDDQGTQNPNDDVTFADSDGDGWCDVDEDGAGLNLGSVVGDDASAGESGADCFNNRDDDGDGTINDGCPATGSGGFVSDGAIGGAACLNGTDDDFDDTGIQLGATLFIDLFGFFGDINDGCPGVSIPEDLSVRGTCDNGKDDDGDSLTDLNDPGCKLPNHNIRLTPLKGDKKICFGGSPSNEGSFQVQIIAPSGGELAEVGVLVDSVIGTTPDPVVDVTSVGPVVTAITAITGSTTVDNFTGRALNVDGDTDLEYEARAHVDFGTTPVARLQIDVTFPDCTSEGANDSAFDYVVAVDVCHGDDISPMALFAGSTPDTCRALVDVEGDTLLDADGGQDRSFSNDAPQTRNVDDESK